MAWFSWLTRDVVDLQPDEIRPESAPASLIDRGRASVGNMLDRFHADERALVADIEDKTEQLRQTRIAIQAFEAADKILVAGDRGSSGIETRTADAEKPAVAMKRKAVRS